MEHRIDVLSRMVRAIDVAESGALVRALLEARAVHLAGAGRAGLVLQAFGARLTELGRSVHLVGSPLAPALGPEDLLLVCSSAGQASGPVVAAERAARAGGRVALLTGGVLSPVARFAHVKVLIPPVMPAVPEVIDGRRVAVPDDPEFLHPLRVLFEQAAFLFLDLVADELVRLSGQGRSELESRRPNLH